MRRQAFIGHLDADCFYVSAERARDGLLDGLPVGVLGNQGACVIAKSYEMKAAGVATGEPIWEALEKCPQGVYVKRDFRWYEVLSRMMLDVVREHSPRVEYYSIDEFFFEAVPAPGDDFEAAARRLRGAVMERVRVPVTIGIGRSRTLAKLISDTAKPFGAAAILDRPGEESLLAARPVTDVTGIAGRRARRLAPWGIASCLEFAAADRRLIRQLLTAAGEALWWELNGEAVLPIRPERPRHQVISRGGSLGEPVEDPHVLYAWLVRNAERLAEELHYHAVCAGRVAAWVAYRDGRAGQGRAALAAPTDRLDVLLDALRPCLRRAWIPRVPATRMHLFAESLTPRRAVQLSLFDPPAARADVVAEVKRAVNHTHGRFVLRSAATLPLREIYRDTSNSFDICDVHGKICF